jgi:hypothetical protein
MVMETTHVATTGKKAWKQCRTTIICVLHTVCKVYSSTLHRVFLLFIVHNTSNSLSQTQPQAFVTNDSKLLSRALT